MKFSNKIILIACYLWINGCRTSSDIKINKQIKSISKDSLFVLDNAPWQPADTNQIADIFRKDKGVKACELELVKIDQQSILIITTYAIKTSDDSLYIFYPADYGATVVTGRRIGERIESSAQSLNGKKITFNNNSLNIGTKGYSYLHKTDINYFYDALTVNHCCILTKARDSAFVQFGGP